MEIFDLRKNREDLHSKMDQMDKEYLSLKYKQDFIMRCEFIAYGMKEAKCDYFTIQIMQFSLEKYLNFQFEFLYEHGVLTNILRSDPAIIESSFMVRIGIICEYYREHLRAGTPDQFEVLIRNCKLAEGTDNRQKKNIFKDFLDLIVYSYRQYLFAYSYYSDEILQSFLAETIRADKICNECLKNTRLAKNEIYIYCSSYGTQDPSIKFKTNIDMMERFQEQLSMQTLEETAKKPTIESQKPAVIWGRKTPLKENSGYIASISSLSEYLQEIKIVNTFLKPKNQKNSSEANLLWYRGQTDKGHILLPGLMRKWKKGSNISPLEKEIAFMDIFSSRTMHTVESDMHLLQNTFDWLVQMQHYSIPTNLLDWSENAFVALFFALIKKDDSITKTDAAVYILNPEYMELARETLVKQTELKSLQRRMYPIANFSKNCYDENNEEFIPTGIKQPVYTRASGWWSDDTGKSDNWWPKPIISSLSNIRIRAQYGAFTIFNLMAKPCFDKTSEDHGYNYLSIENMQQEFLKRYPTENPFLYKINIKKDFVEDIAKELKCAGYRIMNVYPELENISNAIVKQIDAYFKG